MRFDIRLIVLFALGNMIFTLHLSSQNIHEDYLQALKQEYQTYATMPHPADFPSFTVSHDTNLKAKQSLLANQNTIALRGNIELIFQADQTEIQVSVSKRDINVAHGADELSFTIFNAFDEPIETHTIPDDGNTTNDLKFNQIQNQLFTITLPDTGIYLVRTDTNSDLYYDISVSSQRSALVSTLEFIDGTKTVDLYFQAPAGQITFDILTHHFAGFPQTLRIHDSNDKVIERLFVDEISKNFQVVAKVPEEEVGKIWRLHIQKQDLIIQSPDVQFWFRSPGEFFDVSYTQQLLQLRVLEMSGLPGMRLPFRFEMENIRSADVTVFPEFEHQSGFEMAMETFPASMTIASASRRLPFFYGNIPDDASPGDVSEFLLTLKDVNGNTIVSSKIIVDVVEQKPLDPSRQFLFFTPERLEEIRMSGLDGEPYQQSVYFNIRRFADQIVAEGLMFPDEASYWRNLYICDGIGDGNDDPNDGTGAKLIFDPLQPGVYICPLDGERYEGEQYRRGWLGEYYFDMFNRIYNVGMAYHLEPKPEYAQYIRATLLDISDKYRSFRFDDYLGNRSSFAARMMTETLGEAIGLAFLIPAYDAVRASEHFSDEDRAHIEWNFLRPAVDIINGNLMGVTNWQSWHNTAIGLAGFVMDEQEMIDLALHGPNGHDFVRDVAIREDGLWQEGSVGYHFFGMTAMNLLLEAMEAHALEPFDEKIELAYSSILDIMQPDGKFPALNDSSADFIQWRAAHYEIANGHFDNPKFDEILRFIYETRGYGRGTIEAMFFGKAYEDTPLQIDSTIKDSMGLSTLRSGTGLNDQVVMMDYGPHGQFHGHLDKLHVSLYGAGEEWLPDLGTGQTNTELYTGWFRTTLGHNTIMVGEQPQGFDTEIERPIRFYHNSFPEMQIMQSEFGAPVYPEGVNVRRTVISSGDHYSIIIDDVEGAQGPVDFVFHSSGIFENELLQEFEPLGGAPGWERNLSGYRFLLPPVIRDMEKPENIMRNTTSNGMQIITSKEYGFTDGLESLEDWSGNINLSDDAVEGNTSLSWVIVSRSFQSIQKSFETLNEFKVIPDRITFNYKIETNTFDFFTMQLIDLPNFQASNWVITSGAEVTPNEWQLADIDLTSPDWENGTNLQFNQIRFSIQNANQFEGAFKVFIDNIQAWKNGNVIQPEKRNLRLLFSDGDETQYFLANGPSIIPPRTHPVLVARRNDSTSTQNAVAVIPETINSSNRDIAWLKWLDENTLQLVHPVADPLFYIDTTNNQYAAFNLGIVHYYLAVIGTNNFSNRASIDYFSENKSNIYLDWTFMGPDNLIYNKLNTGDDEVVLHRLSFDPHLILLNGEEFDRFQVKNNSNGTYNLHLYNLPVGENKFDILSTPFSDIQSWELY